MGFFAFLIHSNIIRFWSICYLSVTYRSNPIPRSLPGKFCCYVTSLCYLFAFLQVNCCFLKVFLNGSGWEVKICNMTFSNPYSHLLVKKENGLRSHHYHLLRSPFSEPFMNWFTVKALQVVASSLLLQLHGLWHCRPRAKDVLLTELYSLSFRSVWLAVTRVCTSYRMLPEVTRYSIYSPNILNVFYLSQCCGFQYMWAIFQDTADFLMLCRMKIFIPWEKDKMNIGGKLAVCHKPSDSLFYSIQWVSNL